MITHTKILYSGTISASGNTTATYVDTKYDKEGIIFLNISAATGTNQTLDLTFKVYDEVSSTWHEIAHFDQKTAAGTDCGYIEYGLNDRMAVYYVLGGTATPTFTCTISICLKNH